MDYNRLAVMALTPGTTDKSRYARNIRAQVRIDLDQSTLRATTILNGLLRSVDRTDSVETNRQRLAVAVDLLRDLCDTSVDDAIADIANGTHGA